MPGNRDIDIRASQYEQCDFHGDALMMAVAAI